MSRLLGIQTETANARTKQLLEAVRTKPGITPTMTRVPAEKERVTDNGFKEVRRPGVGDGEIAEIIKLAARELEEV